MSIEKTLNDFSNLEKEQNVFIENEMKTSYLDYSMSVIIGRALPDVRDGLKPVHRRILFAMNETGMDYNKPFKKSARIVGEVLGKYHPHGDSSVYLAMVRMAQDFNMRYPLISGQGNYGSIDGDSPASMRYTEARLSKLASIMLEDLDKETVSFKNNFDESLKEPEVLPSKIPNLLLNGSSGIAVGMATNIPPHNLNEVCDAVLAMIEKEDIEIEELITYVKGPDFPTGGVIVGKKDITKAYKTGRGVIKVRGKARIEKEDKRDIIIIYELPYQVNKSSLVLEIAELVKAKKIEGISDLRDESNREGIRIYIQVKKDENPELILNRIYKYTNLQVSFGIIMLAIVENVPKVLNLKEILKSFLRHRFDVVTKRTKFDLKKAEERLHILEGFKISISNIDETVKIIKGSKDIKDAREQLISKFKLSDIQAQSVLDMRLSKLTSLEVNKLIEDIKSLKIQIVALKTILSDDKEIYKIIAKDIKDIKNEYKSKRKTEITDELRELNEEDLIKDDQVLVTITGKGYIKRQSLDEYKSQKLGGKGYTGQGLNEDDFIKNIYTVSNLDTLLIFTDSGKVHKIKVYEIPESSRIAKGKLLSNLININLNDKIRSIIRTRNFDELRYLIFVTKKGLVKKTKLSLFKNISKVGIIAIKLRENDDLLDVFFAEKDRNLFLATRKGYAITFKEDSIRASGRSSLGVKGITFRESDSLIAARALMSNESTILTIAEKGYGKRTPTSEYTVINRGGKGITNMKLTSKTGEVVLVEEIINDEEMILITSKGSIIRTMADKIAKIGRSTQGVRIIKLREKELVVDAAKIPKEVIKLEI